MKKNIKLLVLKSKTNKKLDAAKIRKIARELTRAELKKYLLFLKQERSREKVIIETPIDIHLLGKDLVEFLKKKFKDKEIELSKNEELIGGLKLKIDDNVLDYSFKNILEKAI